MTDFFAELEGHLHDAARRRARRRWLPEPAPRIVFAVAVAAATVAVVFAGLTALDTGGDPEVAAPAPVVESDCDRAPAEVVRSFSSALDRAPQDYEKVPPSVAGRLTGELPGGRAAPRTFPEDGRLALRDKGRDFWLVPARFGDDCDGDPGLCWNVVTEDANLVDCRRLDELDVPVEMVRDEGPQPWIAALVAEGVDWSFRSAEPVQASEQAVRNVVLVDHEPVEDAQIGESTPVTPFTGCKPMFTDNPVPAQVREHFPVFESSGELVRTEVWSRALGGHDAGEIHDANGRVLLREAGVRLSAVAASLVNCDKPGVCAAAEYDDGRATEYGADCWTMAQVLAGQAVAFYGTGDERTLVYALVPAGTGSARYDGQEMQMRDNLAFLVVEDRPTRRQIDM